MGKVGEGRTWRGKGGAAPEGGGTGAGACHHIPNPLCWPWKGQRNGPPCWAVLALLSTHEPGSTGLGCQ